MKAPWLVQVINDGGNRSIRPRSRHMPYAKIETMIYDDICNIDQLCEYIYIYVDLRIAVTDHLSSTCIIVYPRIWHRDFKLGSARIAVPICGQIA